MLPCAAGDNQRDSVSIDTILNAERLLSDTALRISGTNLADNIRCQFARMTIRNLNISHVVSRSAEVEMVNADTGRVVARMQDVQAAGDWTVVEQPRGAVRTNRSLAGSEAELSISERVLRCGPYPAVTGLVNFLPESFRYRACSRGVVARARAVDALLFAFLLRVREEVFPALNADARDARLSRHSGFLSRIRVAVPPAVSAARRRYCAHFTAYARGFTV
jgi:hypothetical protein